MARIGLVLVFALVVGLALSQAGTIEAQGARAVVIGGLDSPRGLTFGPDGKLYVAEAGTGGDEQSAWVPPFQTAKIGTTGRILRIDGGQSTVVASGLQSVVLGQSAETTGANDLAFLGSTLYVIVGQANALPTGKQTFSLLVKIGSDGKAETIADLGKFERDNNPDGTVPDTNPFGLAAGPDGNLYVADAGGNDLLKVTPAGEVSAVTAWKDNPVPTSVAFDKSGRAHVAFLSHAPFIVGSSRLERITPGGTEIVVPNLTMIVDLKIGPDGMPYLLQHSAEFVTSPPPPAMKASSGRVLRVGANGLEEMAGGLNFPTKMAFGPDGALYVTNNAVGAPKGGEILKLTLPATGSPVTVAPPAQPSPAAAPSPAAKPVAPAAAPAAPPAQPSPAAKPAPAQAPAAVPSPSALPRTGIGPDVVSALTPVAGAGAALMLVGLGLLRRRRR